MRAHRYDVKTAYLVMGMVLLGGARLVNGLSTSAAAPADKAMIHLYERMDVMEPLFLYHDFGWGGNADFAPSGWMGDTGGLSVDEEGQSGGFLAGYEGGAPEPRKLLWCSTEHNIDVLAAARRLAQATGDTQWDWMAEHAARFLERMYHPDGYFWTGILTDGTINGDTIPLDCQTWAVLAFADGVRSRELLSWSERNLKAVDRWQGRDIAGYSYSTAEKGVWTEGSAQMGLACLQAGRDLVWSLPAGASWPPGSGNFTILS